MKLGLAIQQAQVAERDLAALAPFAERYPLVGDADEDGADGGLLGELRRRLFPTPADAEPAAQDDSPGLMETMGEKTSELMGRRPVAGLLLLRDMRLLYLHASAACINWAILERGAEAARDEALLQMVHACQQETQRTLKWTETMVKSLSPQVLMT
jgi:hypothetical protein